VKRIEYDRYGGPELMRVAAFDTTAVGRSDILVKVEAASINPVDWGIRSGKMKMMTGSSFPRVMGKDFSGTILEVGANVVGWKPGDAVFGCVPWRTTGSFSSLAIVHASDIAKKPPLMSFAQAAALPTAGLTAWHGLVDRAKLTAGQTVLVNGAAGSVGIAAIQIAQSVGAVVTARVGGRSFSRMRSIGVTEILDYRESLPSNLDRHFDVVMDCNGSLDGRDIDRLLKRGGTAVDITFRRPKLLRAVILRRQKLASGSVDHKTMMALGDLAASGRLVPDVGTEVDIDNAIPLITRLEGGERFDGKAVILLG
jgi:NADPH:quinone reductase-like Zn-dependent oxidoreductase